jgi:hypothetical protein
MRSLVNSRFLPPFAAMFFATALWGQTAQITGQITDQSGAALANAAVRLTHAETGAVRSVTTSTGGYYTVPLLPRGAYTVQVEMNGFRSAIRRDALLDEGQALRVDFQMELGQVAERIEVKGAAQLINTENQALTTVVPNQRIVDLPLVGRNPIALAALVPGVRTIGAFAGLAISAHNTTSMTIGGGAPSSNNFMIDGTTAESWTSGGIQIALSVDATEEFRIITRNPSAEYGRTGGGVVAVVSKSGTNTFHGNAFEFHRNRALNANDFFGNRAGRSRAPFVFNQYGATFGGPISKDKTFFFGNWEAVKQRTELREIRTVPTAPQKQGDFSQTRDAQNRQVVIYDPLSSRPDPANPGNRIRSAFPGNLIPRDRIHPVSRAVADYYPAANTPGALFTDANNFFGQASRPVNKDVYGIKLDHYLNPSRRVSGRYTYDRAFQGFPNFFGNIAETGGSDLTFPRDSVNVNYTDAFRPNLLFEARAGLHRYAPVSNSRSLGFDVSLISLPGKLNQQVQLKVFPRFSVTDTSPIGSAQNDYLVAASNTWSTGSALTYIRGPHAIKTGGEFRAYQLNSTQDTLVMQWDFARNFTRGPNPNDQAINAGYGFATYLLGTPTGGGARRYQPATYTQKYFGAFVQDDWKVTRRLTLNLGLRWDFEGAVTDRYNAISNFDPALQTTANGLALRGGLIYPGVGGLSRGYRNNWWKDFGPRFGFAYQAIPRMAVRGGYGIYYLPTTGNFERLHRTGYSVDTPFVSSIDGGLTPQDTLTDPFPKGILLPTGSSLGPLSGLGAAVAGNVRSMARPYSQQWNLSVQYELPGSWLIEAGYAGNRGTHLAANREFDYLPAAARSLGTALQTQLPNPYAGLITTGTLSQPAVTRATLLDTYPQFAGVSGIDHWASSIYHGLLVRVERRFAGGFSLLGAYTYSKLIDDNVGNGLNNFVNSGANTVQNWDNLRSERAISTSDLPQRLVITPTWRLPFLKNSRGALGALAGGWQVNGIMTLQTGEPIGIVQNAPAFGGSRPNAVGDPTQSNPTIDRWFNTQAFAAIPAFTFGNSPRNLPRTRTDGLFNLDFSLFKNVHFTERVQLQLRGEAFNLTNTPTFGTPGVNLTNAGFGVVSTLLTATEPRRIQIGAKLSF